MKIYRVFEGGVSIQCLEVIGQTEHKYLLRGARGEVPYTVLKREPGVKYFETYATARKYLIHIAQVHIGVARKKLTAVMDLPEDEPTYHTQAANRIAEYSDGNLSNAVLRAQLFADSQV